MSVKQVLKRLVVPSVVASPARLTTAGALLLAAYLVGVELLFQHSKLSHLRGSSYWELLRLGVNVSVLLAAGFAAVGLLAALPVWLARRRGATRAAEWLSALLCPLPFVGISLLTYLFVDRWLYSAYGEGVVQRPMALNVLLLVLGVAAGYALYALNAASLLAWTRRRARRIRLGAAVVLAGAVVSAVLSWTPTLEVAVPPRLPGAGPAHHPNIVLLTYDMFVSSRTPLLGYARNTTPNLLRRKGELQVFANAMAIATDSRSGNGALLLGRSPVTTGLYQYPSVLTGRNRYRHLPGILRKLGYYTLNVGSEPYSDPDGYWMKDGFTEVYGAGGRHRVDAIGPGGGEGAGAGLAASLGKAYPMVAAFLGDVAEDYGAEVGVWFGRPEARLSIRDRALVRHGFRPMAQFMERLETLATQHERPFFIHFHAVGTHKPVVYRRHAVFSHADRGETRKCRNLLAGGKDCDGTPLTHEQLLDIYDDALLDMDEDVERMLELLERTGRAKDTLFILTTDHELDWKTTGDPVALMVRLPGGYGGGRIIRKNVWLLDVTPTLLELLGYRPPDWMDGISLVPLLETPWGSSGPLQPRPMPMHVVNGARRTLRRITLADDRYKYTRWFDGDKREQVYDASGGLDGPPIPAGARRDEALESMRAQAAPLISLQARADALVRRKR